MGKKPLTLDQTHSFAVYTLSRGAGVPEEALKALFEFEAEAKKMHETGAVLAVSKKRLGLEGEMKVCCKFKSAAEAKKAWSDITKKINGVDLIRLAVESCDAPSSMPGGQ